MEVGAGELAHAEPVLKVRRQWQKVTLGRLAPGSYRFEIDGRSDTAPLSDVFAVAAPDEMTEP